MKNFNSRLLYKLILCAAAVCVAAGAAGCKKDTEPEVASSAPASTVDTAVSSVPEEVPDIGEHKDYDKEDAESYESGSILVASQDGTKRGMELYTMVLGDGCLEFYANELNQQKSDSKAKVRFYSMIVPTACELYCPANQRHLIDSQEDIIANVKDMFVGVEQVDVLPTLRNHNAEDIYYRTDSRWTPLGAYYAGRVFAKAAGVPYVDISEYTKTPVKEGVGDFVNICGPQADAELREHPDKYFYYEPNAKFTTHYYDDGFTYLTEDKFYFGDLDENSNYENSFFGTYMPSTGGDLYADYYRGGYYSLRLDTKVKNGRKLLLVKDEFGTALPPFLTSSFEQIYVVSYDYLGANIIEVINDFKITDVLYLMNTYTVTDTRVYTIETLRTQATHGSLRDGAPDSDSDSDSESDSDKKSSDSDTENGEEGTSSVEYIYDVGINNQVGIASSSDDDGGNAGYDDNTNDGDDDETVRNDYDYDDGNDDYSYEDYDD